MRRAAAMIGALLFASACFGSDPGVTEAGEGRPQLHLVFPDIVEPESLETAVFHVSNPGPGDIATVVVAFALVGPGKGESEIPNPLVAFGRKDGSASIVSVDPRPTAVSRKRSVYTFQSDGASPAPVLPAGGSMTIEFEIRTPSVPGVAANSVTVYDGSDVDRVVGARIEAQVRG